MLHLFPHWNWKGPRGVFLPVACYTNCDSVELFLNGRSVGVKGYTFPRYGMQGRYGQYAPAPAGTVRTTSDLHLAWDVPYEPGTLKAVGMKGGKAASEVEVSTTGEPDAIGLSVGPGTIRADRRDVAHVPYTCWTRQGRFDPEADNEIPFDIEGRAADRRRRRKYGRHGGGVSKAPREKNFSRNVSGDGAIHRRRGANPPVRPLPRPQTSNRHDRCEELTRTCWALRTWPIASANDGIEQ